MLYDRKTALRVVRRVVGLVAGVACLSGLFVAAAQAKCGGADILPKLVKSHPEIMKSVRKNADRIINTKAILWRVEKAGIAPSHLFGTMHISDERVTALSKAAREAVQSARLVALEIADVSPGAMMQAVQKQPQLMVYTDGSRLDKKLTEPEFKRVSGLLTKTGLPAQMVKVMRPWMISTLLGVPVCEQQRVAAGEKALDAAIAELARSRKIPVVGLETIES